MFKDDYISGMRKVSASPELRARLVRAMEQEQEPVRRPARRFPRAWAGIAAAAAAVAVAVPVWMNGLSGAKSTAGVAMQDAAAPSAAAYAVAPEEESELTADGAPETATGGTEPRIRAENGQSGTSCEDGAGLAKLNPTYDLPADEMPDALSVLTYDVSETSLRTAAQRLADALGLTFEGWIWDGGAGSAVLSAPGASIHAGSSGLTAVFDTDAPLYSDVRAALGELAASLGSDGAELAERSVSDGTGGTFYALYAAPSEDAAQRLTAYALSSISVHADKAGKITSMHVAAPARTGGMLALSGFEDALALAKEQIPDTALHWAVCYGGDGLPYYEFYAEQEADGVLYAVLQVAAVE